MTNKKTFTIDAFTALNLDNELQNQFLVAHNLQQNDNLKSVGFVLRQVLNNRNLLLNPMDNIRSIK